MRILITVTPRMYRESLALTIQNHRPGHEVLFGPVESLNGRTQSLRPHLLIRNDTDAANLESMESMKGSLCWIEVLYSDNMGARVSLDGDVWEIEDMSTEDLLGIVDRVREMVPDETSD